MPTVINGIGTWYYGKRRIHTIKATCEFCGSNADLVSYDTTLYFVVFFVPIFPLGQKRILQQCSICQQHRVLGLAKWQEAKEQDAADLMDKLRDDPNNRDTIMRAIGYSLAYQDEPLFNKVADLAARRPGDAKVQAQLGNAHSYFARWPDAEQAYRAALAVEDDPVVREQLAWALLKQDRPEEARPHLQHVIDKQVRESAGMVYFLIKGYQAQGRHDDALAIMDQRDRAFPDLVNLKEYQQQRKLSTRYQGTDRRVRDAFLDDKGKAGYREGSWTARVPGLIAAAVFLGFLGLYLGSAIWIGQSRKVYLVNGTGKPYTVVIDGKEHTLTPHASTTIRTAEGDVQVSFADAKLGVEPIQGRIESSFWSRPFVTPTFVINPDLAAVIAEEETFYAKANPPPGGPAQIHLGQPVYSMSGIDYEFQEFPVTIPVSGDATVRKTRVGLIAALSPEARIGLLQRLDRPDQLKVCERVLRIEPSNVAFLYTLSTLLPPPDLLKFLETRLDEVPILVEWHRLYQSQMERLHPEKDLRPRYRKLAADTNGHADALYLLGRAEPDVDEAEKLYRQAAAAKPPSANAIAGLAFRALSEGRFTQSRQMFEEAIPLLADPFAVRTYYHDALLGGGDYDHLLQALRGDAQKPGGLRLAAMQMIRVYAIRGDKEAAQQKLAEVVQQAPAEQRDSVRQAMEALIAVSEEDLDGFLKLAVGPSFENAFLRGDLTQAAKLADVPHPDSAALHGLLYLQATRAGAKDVAETQLQALRADLKKRGRDERLFGEILAGAKPLDPRQVKRLPIDPTIKRVLLTVLAQRYPDHAKDLLPLARRLNFERDAISLCLRKFLEEP